MADKFDPYHEWLGIPASEQPPNHYRLLAIPALEESPTVIANAADRQMAHLRTFQAGKHSAQSQKLLNEVATARLCLLNPQKKAAYDRQLRERLGGGMTESDTLGEYRLLEKLGEGGMGAVFKALHTRLDKVVALKVLRKEFLSDSQAVARFDREMKAAGAVDDPMVVRALDAREVGGVRLLAMEFVEGLDLAALITRCSPLSVADACELTRQGALGLQCVHEHKLVHRDIKPSNLMLNRQGQVKLLDLGLAKFETGRMGQEVTATDHAVGTLEYMAPERLGSAESLDIRSDIYALGCTLFKLLAGRTPFAGSKSTASLLTAHLNQAPPRLDKIRRDIPKELAQIVERMLAKSPEKRYASPGDVARALAPFCATSDLRRLLAQAEGFTAHAESSPGETPGPVAIGTETSFSRFLRQAGAQLRRPRRQPTTSEAIRWPKPLVLGGIAIAAVLLLIIAVLGVRAMRAPPPPGQPTLVFQWPLAEREGSELFVDGKKVAISAEASWQEMYESGKHSIRFVRQGYMPYEASLTLQAGQSKDIKPVWQAETCLVLHWPEAERQGAVMEIDGSAVELSKLQAGASADEMRWPLLPGMHKMRINREGFEPFEREFRAIGGKSVSVEPQWLKKLPPEEVAVKPAVPPVTDKPEPTKPVVPTKIEKKGPTPEQQAAAKEAERQAKAREEAARKAAEEERREQVYFDAMKTVEEHAAEWDFSAARKALADVHVEDGPLAARAAARGKELQQLAALKSRMIEKIKAADPPLRKYTLMLRGANGTIRTATDQGIEAVVGNEKVELHAWSSLGKKTVQKLLKIAVQAEVADDWVAAGMLATVGKDPILASQCFQKANSLGANVEPYLGPLAALSFGEAKQLLAKGQFGQAQAALAAIEEKYGTIPWFAAHKASFDAARADVNNGIREKEAEDLYNQAERLLKKEQLFELRPVLEKLKNGYAGTRPFVDAARKPSLADLEMAVAALGKFLTVRKDGKGDFKKIQEAIDAAPPNSLVEIQDAGSYNEQILIPKEKTGLTLRGNKGCWPIITSDGPVRDFRNLVQSDANGTVLDGLVLLHKRPAAVVGPGCVCLWGPSARIRRCVADPGPGVVIAGSSPNVDACLLFGQVTASLVARDSFFFRAVGIEGDFTNVVFWDCGNVGGRTMMKSCTTATSGNSRLELHAGLAITDSISEPIDAKGRNLRIENCCVHGDMPLYRGGAKAGKGCFTADPMFVNPEKLDFRLKPESPCRKKASDGGDLGAHYTPEMIEMLRLAFALRTKGLIDW